MKSYFYGFSIWNEQNICLSWDDTLTYFELLGITPVPVLYDGIYDEELIKNIQIDTNTCEGYVLRLKNQFRFEDFKSSVAKFVRSNHVQTDSHWMTSAIIKNELDI